jgi:hypothetical protein
MAIDLANGGYFAAVETRRKWVQDCRISKQGETVM